MPPTHWWWVSLKSDAENHNHREHRVTQRSPFLREPLCPLWLQLFKLTHYRNYGLGLIAAVFARTLRFRVTLDPKSNAFKRRVRRGRAELAELVGQTVIVPVHVLWAR